MSLYKVTVHEDKEYHFTTALKAFDSSAKADLNEADNTFTVTTTLTYNDLATLTSVKKVEYFQEESKSDYGGSGWGSYFRYQNFSTPSQKSLDNMNSVLPITKPRVDTLFKIVYVYGP